MGCSGTKASEGPPKPEFGHAWATLPKEMVVKERAKRAIKDKSEASHATSSWDNLCTEDGEIVQPERKLHDRHLRKLNKFLHTIEKDPKAFEAHIAAQRHEIDDSPSLDDDSSQETVNLSL
ncbi:unnamed protein product [Symbiodinium sp. CCMP2456]|nr:unnamed protein product [Symbiodinium sp. CCMP2456]